MRSKCICTKPVLHHLEQCSDVSKCNSLSEKLFSFRHSSEARADCAPIFRNPKNYFSPCLHTHAKALSPTAHCKLKVCGWFCAADSSQLLTSICTKSDKSTPRNATMGCPILPQHPVSSPQSHDACEHRLRRSSNPCVTM